MTDVIANYDECSHDIQATLCSGDAAAEQDNDLDHSRLTQEGRMIGITGSALTATLVAGTFVGAVKSEEIGHYQFHDSHYRYWKQPGTELSCCSDQDCAPVKAEWREGRWFALRQAEGFAPADSVGTGQWVPLRRSEWIPIPEDKIIRVPNPTVEGAHLCYSGVVLCFVPPNVGG
jgi:hypothetical protein